MENPKNENLPDCNLREILYLAPLVILMFWIGLYPKPFINKMEASLKRVVKIVDQNEASKKVAIIQDRISKVSVKN